MSFHDAIISESYFIFRLAEQARQMTKTNYLKNSRRFDWLIIIILLSTVQQKL